MPLLSVAEIIPDPDFSQSFKINRLTGEFNDNGLFETTTQTLYVTGIITPMKTRDMVQMNTGDQIEGFINIYTNSAIYTTALVNEDSGRLSDEIEWRNDSYKIMSVENFADFGYYHAVAVLKRGA